GGGRQRRPPDITVSAMPAPPGRGPHDLRNPVPADTWVEIPSAVMVSGPTPRLIANPVPSGIGRLPMPIGIRTPGRFNAIGHPAATVSADVFPMAIRVEGLIKIALVTN